MLDPTGKKIWKTIHLENEGQEKNLDIYTEIKVNKRIH